MRMTDTVTKNTECYSRRKTKEGQRTGVIGRLCYLRWLRKASVRRCHSRTELNQIRNYYQGYTQHI